MSETYDVVVIGTGARAVRHNLTSIDLKNTVFSYPTSISDINHMLD